MNEKITLKIPKKKLPNIEIEIENPKEALEKFSGMFYEYKEHGYEDNFQDGELTDNALREAVLKEVFDNSSNTDLAEVLKKVTLLNSFYHTQIKAINLVPIARHILQIKDFDSRIRGDEPDAALVNEIAYMSDEFKTEDIDNVYSFASKYCGWHNSVYPIADSYSKGMLYYINKDDKDDKDEGFYKGVKLSKTDLNDYEIFNKVYNAFKEHYFSADTDNKKIDTYLWTYSKQKISDLRDAGFACKIPKEFDTTDASDARLSDFIKCDSSEIPKALKDRLKKNK